ncbi:MAG TPA: molybdenum cofactor biosynthesis protein MoaE, partial [Thiotrichales bacterium]|nr:molybdenum cofactor biosynthesis protein MoaE [Thiotrichales bacterium]
MPAQIIEQLFNPWQELATYQSANLPAGAYGATACFVGTMRDFNIDEQVTAMTLEHYPAMTGQFLDKLCADSIERFELEDSLIIHRVGLI